MLDDGIFQEYESEDWGKFE